MTRNLAFIAIAAMAAIAVSGCIGTDDLRIAYTFTDDDLNSDKNPQLLADYLELQLGKPVTLFQVDNSDDALRAVGNKQADVAFVDAVSGFFGWQEFGLEAIAADVNSDGRDHYVANAVVRVDDNIETFEDLRGMTSCHTGLLKSAGMFMPLGWMIENGYADTSGLPDEKSSIPAAVQTFFGKANIPDEGTYAGYSGALHCLSDGTGDVAFIKDTTVESYCGDNPESWCLATDDYEVLQVFGSVPTHPVMVGSHVSAEDREGIQFALVSLMEGDPVLDVLEADGIVAVNDTEAYLGAYAENLQHVPGMGEYIQGKLTA